MLKKLKILRYYLLRLFSNASREVPIFIFSYHKCGTKLLGKIFLELSLKYGWKYVSIPGSIDEIPKADVVFFLHSQVDFNKLPDKYIGIHMVRDPRDVIISGYLYHKRTDEQWCVNKNFQTTKTITYPQVPNSQMYRSEQWKRDYIESLQGKSYQEHVNTLSQEDGIFFEMEHYGKWTIEDMLKWDFEKANALELKFEELMENFDDQIMKIFKHCKFSDEQIKVAKAIADKEDINKMSISDIKKNKHISSVKTKKWESYFNDKHRAYFDKHFSEVIKKYNY